MDTKNDNKGSYIKLPEWIQSKKAVLNIKNDDNKCFKWCVLAGLHPINKNPERVSKYKPFENKIKDDDIKYPMTLYQIDKVEEMNNISINVYIVKDENKINLHHITKKKRNVHVNMLLIEEKDKHHYCLIRNKSRLMSSQVSKHNGKKFFCDQCTSHFQSAKALNKHEELFHEAKLTKDDIKFISHKISNLLEKDSKKFGEKGNITLNTIIKLLHSQENKCYICQDPVMFSALPYCCYKMSIDRINDNEPHNDNNILISCYYCNCRHHYAFSQHDKVCDSECHMEHKPNIIKKEDIDLNKMLEKYNIFKKI